MSIKAGAYTEILKGGLATCVTTSKLALEIYKIVYLESGIETSEV